MSLVLVCGAVVEDAEATTLRVDLRDGCSDGRICLRPASHPLPSMVIEGGATLTGSEEARNSNLLSTSSKPVCEDLSFSQHRDLASEKTSVGREVV